MVQNLQYSDIFMYNWGRDYALFWDFTTRGTDQQLKNMRKDKKGSSSSMRRDDDDENPNTGEDMDLGIDWQSLGNA